MNLRGAVECFIEDWKEKRLIQRMTIPMQLKLRSGMSLGFLSAGFEIFGGVELDPIRPTPMMDSRP